MVGIPSTVSMAHDQTNPKNGFLTNIRRKIAAQNTGNRSFSLIQRTLERKKLNKQIK